MTALAFILQVLPVTGMALVATFVGAAVTVGEAHRLPLLLVGVLLFVGLMTFRNTGGWNLALLLGLAAAAGALINSGLDAGGSPSWVGAITIVIVLMALTALIGRALHGHLRRAGLVFWILALIYLAGWLLGGLIDPPQWLRTLWASAGLFIFGGLAMVWFSRLESEEIPPGGLAVGLGADLYFLGLNIAVAVRMLTILLKIA